MEVEGKVALVTGGARRVGRAISLGLAGAGADVIVDYHSSADAAAEVVELVRAAGRRAIAVQADVSSAAGIRRLVDAARAEFGRLDILVNNASLFERAPFDSITEAQFDRVIGVNLRGPFFLTQALAPMLLAAEGVVISIADLSAVQAWPSYAHHAVSKAGLVQLTRVLARALAPVRVNSIVPGTVLPPEDYDGQDNAGGPDRRVVAREGRPEDVVDAVLYLTRSGFVTGECLFVDGGRILL
jgi:NAD(P)-dependent dehydrogenase (short-subunit alcohol dehydrogenase family)